MKEVNPIYFNDHTKTKTWGVKICDIRCDAYPKNFIAYGQNGQVYFFFLFLVPSDYNTIAKASLYFSLALAGDGKKIMKKKYTCPCSESSS